MKTQKNFLLSLMSVLLLSIFFVSCGGGGGSGGGIQSDNTVSVNGLNGASGVSVSSVFKYVFSQAIDISTVDTDTFFLVSTSAAPNLAVKADEDPTTCDIENAVSAIISCLSSTECRLTPSTALNGGTGYTICLSAEILYANGQPFEGFMAGFTTTGSAPVDATYQVTYDGNGNTGGEVPVDGTSYEEGQTVTMLDNTGTLVRTGNSFAGWNTSADGTGTTYTVGQTFTMGTADVTLYARWTTNPTYTVTYNSIDTVDGAVPTDSTNYEEDQTVTVLGNTGGLLHILMGSSFVGWNTAADGSGTTYAEGETFTMGSVNVTLYAKWFMPTEEDAEAALSLGTTVLDETEDYVNLHENPLIDEYYLDFADLTQADYGLDDYYLYVKYEFVGTWPVDDADWPIVGDDQVYDFGCSTNFDTDNNPDTGSIDDSGAEIMTSIGYRLNDIAPYFYDIKTDPNPDYEWGDPEEERFLTRYYADYSFMFGGSGYDYVIIAYPLRYLDLSAGQNVTAIAKCEGTSYDWADLSFDPLGIVGDYDERRIEITLGENVEIPYLE